MKPIIGIYFGVNILEADLLEAEIVAEWLRRWSSDSRYR